MDKQTKNMIRIYYWVIMFFTILLVTNIFITEDLQFIIVIICCYSIGHAAHKLKKIALNQYKDQLL